MTPAERKLLEAFARSAFSNQQLLVIFLKDVSARLHALEKLAMMLAEWNELSDPAQAAEVKRQLSVLARVASPDSAQIALRDAVARLEAAAEQLEASLELLRPPSPPPE